MGTDKTLFYLSFAVDDGASILRHVRERVVKLGEDVGFVARG